MACYSPLQAYRNPYDHAGPLLFSPPHSGLSASANIALSGLKIPCGQCICDLRVLILLLFLRFFEKILKLFRLIVILFFFSF